MSVAPMLRELVLTTLDGDVITHKVDLVTTVGEFKAMLLQHKCNLLNQWRIPFELFWGFLIFSREK